MTQEASTDDVGSAKVKLGVAGGMGPLATSRFCEIFLEEYVRIANPKRDQDFPDMAVYYDCANPDRTKSFGRSDETLRMTINRRIESLLANGYGLIVVPCVTAHAFIDFERFKSNVIDFRDRILSDERYKAGGRIAALCTDGTRKSGSLNRLRERFELRYPCRDNQRQLMDLIYGPRGLKSGRWEGETVRREIEKILADPELANCDYVMLACTELEAFCARFLEDMKLIEPMRLMAQVATERLRGRSYN